jgi:hypothetical protein
MKASKHSNRSKRRARSRTEWVGGRLVSPFYITEDPPYRPEMILWLEMPEPLILAHELIDPKQAPVAFGETLRNAMSAPMVGPSRRPDVVRVADPQLAAEVRRVLPRARVVVAPTPELDEILAEMSAATAGEGGGLQPSYFEEGRVGAEAIAQLFCDAARLYEAAPWTVAADDQILRVDIPRLGVRGACLSIIGALGQSVGLILFPSLEGFERFVAAGDPPEEGGPLDLGTSALSLGFQAGAELPPSMHREALDHGWPVAGPQAYPLVQHWDPDGVVRPLTERDVGIAAGCAAALAAFFLKHRDRFEHDAFDEPIREAYPGARDLEVHLAAPYEAGEPPETGAGAPEPTYEIDRRLVRRMARFAERRFGEDWALRAGRVFRDPDASMGLAGPWAFHHHRIQGTPLAQWVLESEGERLPRAELDLLRAQRCAWISVWEVQEAEPGVSLTLSDLLTGETRTIRETTASRSLVKHDAMLARVVDYGESTLLCGLHPRALDPRSAAVVVQRMHAYLRRMRLVPVERMRPLSVARHLIADWEEAVAVIDARRERPPELVNTEGQPLLLTVDHFRFARTDRAEIARRLAAAEGVQNPPDPGDPEPVFVFTRPGNPMHRAWENTIVGQARIAGTSLQLTSNSTARADALRALIENALGPLIHHRAREQADPRAAWKEREAPPPALPSAEENRIILEMKARHYADWTDHPLPALHGLTPRAAVRTKAGRRRVALLLKEAENHESRLPAGQRFDFGRIRRKRGLED